MNWKYLVIILVVVIGIVLTGSIFIMQNNSKSSPIETKTNYFEENISASEILRPATGVYRELSSSLSSSSITEVSLNVTVGNSQYYVIEEIVPANWTVTNSGTGTVDKNNHIKWLVLADAKDTILKYTIAAPSNPGKYLFSGKYAIGSKDEFFIIGRTQIQVN